MKSIHSIIAVATLAFTLSAAPTMAAQPDPETILYRISAVLDNGGNSFNGVASFFSCTNFSGVTENVRFVTRDVFGSLKANSVFAVDHLSTQNTVTHPISGITGNSLNTGLVAGGTIAIAATSINIVCTAMIIDASGALTQGIALRGIRFNPIAGSQE